MADYPFKINITTKDGTKKSFYDADFATSSDTVVSASLMVTRINAMKSASSFIDGIEAPSLTSTNYNNTSEGIKFLSASVTHPNTGSVVFTDTEETDLGGLDHYEFYGSKVCSVLGLPEGIPIYTENFKLSDSSTDTTNYISGEFISDRVAIKRGFKMSPQARMQSNLIWDEAFGEGIIQWVSGSNTRLFIGYDDVANQYKIAGGAVTFNISGVDELTSTLVSTNDVEAPGRLDLCAGGSGHNDVFIGTQGNGNTDISDSTEGSLKIDNDGNNQLCGHFFILGNETADFQDLNQLSQAGTITHDGQGNKHSDYQLNLVNDNNDAAHRFAGISFYVGTDHPKVDPFNTDKIGASIAAVRDSSANNNANLADHNLVFCTNDASDDGNKERLVIFHDGEVRAKHTISSSAFQTDGNITVGGTVDGIDIAGSLNQAVKTTSAVTFATVNTGQGANELYDMNQNVTTTSTPTFADLTLTDDLIIADRITHSGDTDTYISFQDNVIDIYTGNTETLELKSTTSTFNGTLGVGADVSTGTLYIKPTSEQNASLAEAVNRGLHLSSKADMNSTNKFMPPLVWRSNDSQLVSTDYANIAMIGIETGFHGTNQNRATMVFRTADDETGTGTEHFRIRYDGVLTATDTSIGSNSDIRTKTNIVDYTGPVTGSMSGSTSLELIESLNMKHFEYTGDYGSIKGKKRVGVIAQEVTGSVPYIVTSDMHQIDENWYTDDVAGGKIKVEPTGSLTEVYNVSLGDLVPDMVNAIKDLSQQVKELRAQISGSG